MPLLQIDVDADLARRAEAFAAARRTSVARLVGMYLRSMSDDIVAIRTPHRAERPAIFMLRHDGRDQVASYLARSTWHEFETPMPQHLFACALGWPGRIVDVGANTGFYALLCATASAENEVLAFEADPALAAPLGLNIAANDLEGRIRALQMAVSSKVGRAPLFVPPHDHGLIETSSSMEWDFKPRHAEMVEVETTTIDAALQHADGPDRPVTLIKIDAEGHECAVLEGADAVVSRWRPVIFVEILDRSDRGFLSGFLLRHGYLDVPLRDRGTLAAQGVVTFEQDAWNHAFVPVERITLFLNQTRAAP